MTGNCSASKRVLANSLRVVSAKRGNRDLTYQKIHWLRDAAFGADCLTPFRILNMVISLMV